MPAPITTACLPIRVEATATSPAACYSKSRGAASISLCAATKHRNLGLYVFYPGVGVWVLGPMSNEVSLAERLAASVAKSP
jgi:hypothetical protein